MLDGRILFIIQVKDGRYVEIYEEHYIFPELVLGDFEDKIY